MLDSLNDTMEVRFKSDKEQTFYEDAKALQKKFGKRMADKIVQRIDDLEAANNPQALPQSARWHEHQGTRSGLYSLDLIHPFRLIVRPVGEFASYVEIEAVEIFEVYNSHK